MNIIQELMAQIYAIVIKVAALPFNLIDQVLLTLDGVLNIIFPIPEQEEYVEPENPYPEPTEVQGFLKNNEHEQEEHQ